MAEIAQNHDPESKRPMGPKSLAAPPRLLRQKEEVRLAALAVGFRARLRAADMPAAMQERAIRHARALLDCPAAGRRPNPTLLARSLKKEFDSVYGPAWHCVAGKSFGSFVTHSPGGFVYFSVDSLFFLLFKTQVHVITHSSPKH
ncbi:dynein light chain 1 [Striga asiatica]|uniref:Dynein light chain n=1 Tax=Striga asiatica TaxID=4170 RepID=A0A5A7R8W8_STRAF|nr:dynein light chain 1 [Striga asiatica]